MFQVPSFINMSCNPKLGRPAVLCYSRDCLWLGIFCLRERLAEWWIMIRITIINQTKFILYLKNYLFSPHTLLQVNMWNIYSLKCISIIIKTSTSCCFTDQRSYSIGQYALAPSRSHLPASPHMQIICEWYYARLILFKSHFMPAEVKWWNALILKLSLMASDLYHESWTQ